MLIVSNNTTQILEYKAILNLTFYGKCLYCKPERELLVILFNIWLVNNFLYRL